MPAFLMRDRVLIWLFEGPIWLAGPCFVIICMAMAIAMVVAAIKIYELFW